MSSYSSLFRVPSPFRVQTKIEENSPLVRNMAQMILNCFILGDTRGFPVVLGKKIAVKNDTIPFEIFNVGLLTDYIWEKKKEDIIGSSRIDLWKVEIEDTYENREKLKNTKINIEEESGGERLSTTKLAKNIFSDGPPDERIHILVQQLPSPATTRKRPLEYSDEGQNSKRAKLVDPNMISTARKIMENIMKLDEDGSSYSNPKKIFSLPFPYPGQKKPIDRFAIDDDGFFNFMGRKEFKNVLTTINKLRSGTGYMKLFVYGTIGYGKSHILSAITCFLLRTGHRVVYLPDCRQLSAYPEQYVKSALFLTYHDDDAKISKINSCENFEDIIDFCIQLKEKLYFVVDQMNALDEQDDTGLSTDIKRQVRQDLDKMTYNHYYIMSSSANNKSMLHLMAKQTGELKVKLFGGFDEEEMKEWWNMNNPNLPAMDQQQIGQIEDITGKIPLFLNFLLESGHNNFKDALEHLNQKLNSIIQIPVTKFSECILSKDNNHNWELHVQVLSSFLTNNSPPLGYGEGDYDHRYFYINNNICHYVCGLVRNCMANYLYEKGRMELFVDVKWIKAFKNNPSVKGFIVEKACLASIYRSGITVNKTTFKVNGHQFFSSAEDINFSLSEAMCTFYLPRKWNQKSIDGLLARYETNTLYIAPIQITFNKEGHSDSEASFFSGIWPELESNIPNNSNKEVIFIWITRKNGIDEEVKRKFKKLRNRNVDINPYYTSVVTGFANVNRDIDRYLSQV